MKYQVIIPVYNGEDVIEACLESVTKQENAVIGEDYSVLVIDDGSTDRTVEIAARFPVEIISLGENRGRTTARLTGAGNARSERLAFVDSRVTVPPGFISTLDQFGSFPAVMGVAEPKAVNPRLFLFDRVLSLIRRRYYGPDNYPIKGEGKLLTPENFKRTSKGTTFLLIDREYFIKCSPERSGKDVSDDTILFHNMVFGEKLKVLISPRIHFEYDAARKFWPFLVWLFERGNKFTDYYLRKGGYFRKHFIAIAVLALIWLAATVFSPPQFSLAMLWVAFACYLFLCVWLSETIQDFPVLIFGLPLILLTFGSGVLTYWIKALHHPKR